MDTMYSTLLSRVSRMPRGTIFFVEDLLDTGISPEALRAVLSLMVRDGSGEVIRLARGIFCRPALNPQMKILYPSGERIAQEAARHWRVRIAPCGAQAANLAGFYGVPVLPLDFVTDGSEQTINLVNGNVIHFMRRKSVKVFSFRNERLRNLVEGVRFLGKENISFEEREIIAKNLVGIPEGEFIHDVKLSPGWIQEILLEIRPSFT